MAHTGENLIINFFKKFLYFESFLGNETHKILLDFGIPTIHSIQARRPINKKKTFSHLVDLASRMKMIEGEKLDKYMEFL